MIRGDAAEESLYRRAEALVAARGIESESNLGPLFETSSPDDDPEVLKPLRQMYEACGWVLLESSIADLPVDLRWVYESDAVSIEQLAALHQALGLTSAADLAAAVREERIRGIEGLDAEVEAKVGGALPGLRALVARLPLGRATTLAEPVLATLRGSGLVEWALPVGSLRRGQDMVGDIEIVAATAQPRDVVDALLQSFEQPHVLHRSDRRLYFLRERVQIGVRLPEPGNAGATLLHLTGSTAHFDALRVHAAAAGWNLTSNGLYATDGQLRPSPTEDAIYATIGLPCVPVEIRNGDDEIAAAAAGTLPELVGRRHIRGDLHMHSTWSDGRDTIEAMVEACRALKYEYIAITDHSPHSAATRNLTADGVTQQAEEIAQLRERCPDITILHGCEVDILPDGRLDFPDRILERFD